MYQQTNTDRRFVELEDLRCGGCGSMVADEAAGFVHVDGSVLCGGDVVEQTAGDLSPLLSPKTSP